MTTILTQGDHALFGSGTAFYVQPNDFGLKPPAKLQPPQRIEAASERDANEIRRAVRNQPTLELQIKTLREQLQARHLLPASAASEEIKPGKDGYSEEQLEAIAAKDPATISQREYEQWRKGSLPEYSSALEGTQKRG